MANNNISFVDIAVNANVPIEAPELWTTSMYIGLFMGGYWCRAMAFLIVLMIQMHREQRQAGRFRGAAVATTPFWADWRSSLGSQLSRRGWSEAASDDSTSEDASTANDTYEEVVVRVSSVEYVEVADWDPDTQAIHYWRPFEELTTRTAWHLDPRGKCEKIYDKIQNDPDHAEQV